MSEVRRVAVKMKNIVSITSACKSAGIELVEGKNKNRITVKNHGIQAYGQISLEKEADGTYVLRGDCSERELQKLVAKIKAHYAEDVIIKTAAGQGYNVLDREFDEVNQKIRVKLRCWN